MKPLKSLNAQHLSPSNKNNHTLAQNKPTRQQQHQQKVNIKHPTPSSQRQMFNIQHRALTCRSSVSTIRWLFFKVIFVTEPLGRVKFSWTELLDRLAWVFDLLLSVGFTGDDIAIEGGVAVEHSAANSNRSSGCSLTVATAAAPLAPLHLLFFTAQLDGLLVLDFALTHFPLRFSMEDGSGWFGIEVAVSFVDWKFQSKEMKEYESMNLSVEWYDWLKLNLNWITFQSNQKQYNWQNKVISRSVKCLKKWHNTREHAIFSQ